jgi:DNA repair protein RecO
MPYLRDRAIVLKKEPYREHDRRYYLYGREHGMLIAIARGASSKKSKQAGHLEPFSEVEVMIAKGASFDKLAVARMVDYRLSNRANGYSPLLAAYAIAGAFSDLVVRLTYPGISDERLFELLKELYASLALGPPSPSPERSRLMLSAATLKLLDILGFAPVIRESEANTTPVASLALASFLRRTALTDVWRLTGQVAAFRTASDFIEESLKATHLATQPRGGETVCALLA